ncbi:MAG: hypothetical protein QMB10_00895, partial [Halioglobus sp.]
MRSELSSLAIINAFYCPAVIVILAPGNRHPLWALLHEEKAVHIDQLSVAELSTQLDSVLKQYNALKELNLALDLTRGKPCSEQVALSDALDGILQGNYLAENGTDVRNYGGLEGLAEARVLFSMVLNTPPEETFVGGNSSLTLMYNTI